MSDQESDLAPDVIEEKPKKRQKVESTKSKQVRRSLANHPRRTSTFQTLPYEDRQRYGDMLRLVPDDRGYTAYQRIDAIFAYFVSGSYDGAAQQLGLSSNTVKGWARQPWWKLALNKLKEIKQDELDDKYSIILEKTLETVMDRLVNGEEVITKDGKRIRKPVSMRDAMLVNAISYDKRALHRGDPTSRTERVVTIEEKLSEQANNFKMIARKEKIIDVIPEESIEEDKV